MAQTYIKDIAAHDGQTITIKGWLHNRRSSGKLHFLSVRDGTGQAMAPAEKPSGRLSVTWVGSPESPGLRQ